MNPGNFFAELKRRNVYKVAVAYAVVAWLLIQAASILLPTFEAPPSAMKILVVVLVLGFPAALILSWAFEITPEGIKRADDVDPGKSITRRTGRKLFGITVALAVVAAALLAYQFLRSRSQNANEIASKAGVLAGAIPKKSIAVLPFDNLSDDKQNAYFADGVQDEILTYLAKIADLKVISRTSVMQYKIGAARNLREIGQQLGVSHLLEGSVQRAGGKVRVSAQLIDARTDAHLWAEKYDRPLDDVFAIQSEIAHAIADQLHAKISPSEKAEIERKPTSNLTAFDLYASGKALIDVAFDNQHDKEDLTEAIDVLSRAVEQDPLFLFAYCELARAHAGLYLLGHDHTPRRLALAQSAIDAATRLAPDAGETHLARALHLYATLEYERAWGELAAARRSLPNSARTSELSGYINRRQGRWAESARDLEHAIELDPRNAYMLEQLAGTYEGLYAWAAEAAAYERILAFRPDDFRTKVSRAVVELYWRADTKPLHALIEERLKQNPAAAKELVQLRLMLFFQERDLAGIADALATLGDNTYGTNAVRQPRAYGEGLLAGLKGDVAAAHAAFATARVAQERVVQAQPDFAPALSVLGLIDAGLGRKEDAIQEGRRAVELLPVTKDSINGSAMISNLSIIYAWVGEKDLAVEQVRIFTRLPSGPSYGILKLSPRWDPLRGYPPFEEIIASLAPRDAK
jgi:TolB-like protein/Flp pilus assembly protein TadD